MLPSQYFTLSETFYLLTEENLIRAGKKKATSIISLNCMFFKNNQIIIKALTCVKSIHMAMLKLIS